jgi:integrase
MTDGVFRRGKKGLFTARLQVPVQFQGIVEKPEIWQATGTSDYEEAIEFRISWKRRKLAEWNAMLAGAEPPSAKSRYAIAAELAASRGVIYRTAEEIADGDHRDIIALVESLQSAGDAPGSVASQALLGGVPAPRRTLLELAEEMDRLNPYEVDNKNKQQLHDWKQKWRRVANKLIDAVMVKDIPVDDIQPDHIRTLRNGLQSRVDTGELDVTTANKELQYLQRMIRDHHADLERQDPPNPTNGIRCKAVIRQKKSRKPPVPLPYLQKWVVLPNWRDINDELRDIMLVCLETGCRESEIFNLPPEAIVLDHPIPHIFIQEEEGDEEGEGARQIKTTSSERRVPLVGVALDAMKRHPNGFARYRNNRNFSNAASKSMRAAGLLPSDPVSFKRLPGGKRKPVYVTAGGVRHSFEDRLDEVGVEMDTRGALMGHDVGRIRGRQYYGDKTLEQRLELHRRIMIQQPPALPAPSDAPARLPSPEK